MNAAAGAFAAALCVVCCVVAPLAPVRLPRAAAPGGFRHPDRDSLRDAGWRGPIASWEVLRACCTIPALWLGAATGIGPAIAVAGALLPSLVLRDRARTLRERGRRAVTGVLVGTHAALISGAPLPEALRLGCSTTTDVIARRPFDRALVAFTLGAALDDALRQAAAEERDERTRVALDTLALGIGERLSLERVGALVGALVERLAYEERLDDEVHARAGGARVQVRILAAVVPLLAVYLAATTPGVGATLGGPFGRTVLVPLAALLEVMGIVLSRRALSAVLR